MVKPLDTPVADSWKWDSVYSKYWLCVPCFAEIICYKCADLLLFKMYLLTAVFGASWFDELAGFTGDSRVKQPPVVRIDLQLARDFLLRHCACQSRGEKKWLQCNNTKHIVVLQTLIWQGDVWWWFVFFVKPVSTTFSCPELTWQRFFVGYILNHKTKWSTLHWINWSYLKTILIDT